MKTSVHSLSSHLETHRIQERPHEAPEKKKDDLARYFDAVVDLLVAERSQMPKKILNGLGERVETIRSEIQHLFYEKPFPYESQCIHQPLSGAHIFDEE